MTLDHGAYPTMPIPAPVYLHVVRATLPGAYRVPTFAFRKRRSRSHMQTSYAPDRDPWAVETVAREGLLDRARARDRIAPNSLCAPGPLSRGLRGSHHARAGV